MSHVKVRKPVEPENPPQPAFSCRITIYHAAQDDPKKNHMHFDLTVEA
jgi:hypothetical protein